MKNFYTYLVIIALCSVDIYSQGFFDDGYYIDLDGNKHECFIENIEYNSTFDTFNYMTSIDDEVQTMSMSEIQELSISYYAKYYYKNVLADFSNTDINSLSTDKTLKLKETRLFIKAIVEGKANLYEYANTGTTLFLIYSEKNKQITHLVSKMYLDNDEIKINDIYKTQLEENFECPSISSTQISQITYEEDPLTDLFIDLNKCFDAEYTKYESIKSKTSLRVSVRGGVRNSSFEISSQNDNYSSVEFSGIQGYRAGVELELVIPSKQNNWSIFAEPLIQQQSYKTDVGDQTFKFEYNSVEVPFGVRYYLHLAKHLSVFGNGVFVGSFDFNSSIKGSNQEVINPRSYVNFGCGAGIKAGRIVAEYRYQGRRRLLTTYANITSSYKSHELIVGFTLFKN